MSPVSQRRASTRALRVAKKHAPRVTEMHALRVTEMSDTFRSLFAAVEEQGERVGWLDLEPGGGAAALPVPGAMVGAVVVAAGDGVDALERDGGATAGGALASAVGDGAWKAVAVEPRRTVAVKRRRGPSVLPDLLREHFRGCRVVLVRGQVPLPTLRPRGADWEIEGLEGQLRRLTTAELLRALRAPRSAFGVQAAPSSAPE